MRFRPIPQAHSTCVQLAAAKTWLKWAGKQVYHAQRLKYRAHDVSWRLVFRNARKIAPCNRRHPSSMAEIKGHSWVMLPKTRGC